MQTALSFRHVLTPDGMLHDRTLELGPDGRITAVRPAAGPFDGDLALPGIPNAHSHAFQRALAGQGETPRGQDSFWSWREAMYALAERLDPEAMHAIARHAYAEMLAAGFTSVAEFHYVHHAQDGARGPELALAVVEAAREAGIHLVLLPVFYQAGGFGKPALPEQARFIHATVDDYLGLVARLRGTVPLGVAPHSLRAVPPALLPELVKGARALLGADAPFHIHVAEQAGEVEACRAAHGATPIELLARTVELDRRWNLVHATHASAVEIKLMAHRDATVVICPLTEAYLGDGLMDAEAFVRGGGGLAVGSDANCRIDAVEELRWLEYGQRLRTRHRARLADGRGLGVPLWLGAVRAGARALGQPVGGLRVGERADLVTLGTTDGLLAGHPPERWLDALLIGGSRADIEDVYVGGRRVAAGGRHREAGAFGAAFAHTLRRLSE